MIKNYISFFMVMVTGASFSVMILVSRLFFSEKLVEIIYFQSVVVFFTFIAQLGLRAGGRIHIHLGKIKTMEYITSYIARNSWKFGALLTSITVVFSLSFYPSFIILQAYLSYLQGLYIAKKENKMVLLNSLLLIFSVFVSCAIIVMSKSILYSVLQIELFAVLFLIFLSFFNNSEYPAIRQKRLLISLINRYRGLQYSSYLIYFTAYIFAQIFVFLGKDNQDIIELYADVVLIGGLQVMIIGKLLVFVEGNIIKNKHYNKYLFSYLTWCILSSICLSVLYFNLVTSEYLYIFIFLSMIILSKLAFSFCSQFANMTYRKYIYRLGFIQAAMYLAMYLLIQYDISQIGLNELSLFLFCFSGFSLSAILLVLQKYKKTSFFI